MWHVNLIQLAQLRAGASSRRTGRRNRALRAAHHYLPVAQVAGDRGWQIAECDGQWVAVLFWCAAAKRLKARETWIGRDPRTRSERLKLVVQPALAACCTSSPISPAACSAPRSSICRTDGISATATPRSSPRPSSIRSASRALATGPPAGRRPAPPWATVAPAANSTSPASA